VATSTVSLCRRWRRTFSTSPRPINFLCEFYVVIFKALFCDFAWQHALSHTWWSEAFQDCAAQNSFLVNLMQKLWKSVKIYNRYCKKFTATFLTDHSVLQNKRPKRQDKPPPPRVAGHRQTNERTDRQKDIAIAYSPHIVDVFRV